MSSPNILVVGASIAGPTAAYWLARAGANVTVLERFPQLRSGGQNIDIRISAVSIMRRMGDMEARVRSKLTTMTGFGLVDTTGKPYATIMPSGDPDHQTIASEYEIFRGDLSSIIYDLTKDHPRIKYRFGDQIASMQHKNGLDGPVTVEFQSGALATEYDLVVACDGSTSRTRAMAFGSTVREHMRPVNAWAAYFSVPGDHLGDTLGRLFTAVGGRAVACGPDPSGSSRINIQNVYPRDGKDRTLEFREAMGKGEAELKKYVARTVDGMGWKTKEFVEGMMESRDFYATEIVQVKVPQFAKGRVVLVGDAGYCPSPFTGCGTTLAITGAYVLAGEIATHKGDLDAGLKAYEERMRPLVDELQKIPPGFPSIFAPYTAWGLWLRNNIVWAITSSGIIGLLGRYFGGAAGKDTSGIPEYKFEEA